MQGDAPSLIKQQASGPMDDQLGTLALKRARSLPARVCCLILAVAAYAYIVSVALTRTPWPWPWA